MRQEQASSRFVEQLECDVEFDPIEGLDDGSPSPLGVADADTDADTRNVVHFFLFPR